MPQTGYGYGMADSPLDRVSSEPIQKYGPAWDYNTQFPLTVAEQRGETLSTYQANPSASSPQISGAGPAFVEQPYSDKIQATDLTTNTQYGIAAVAALAVAYFLSRSPRFTISF